MLDVHEAVQKGAALLDANRPGWYRDIDMFRLEMKSPHDCVVSQTFGGYAKGCQILLSDDDTLVHRAEHGYSIHPSTLSNTALAWRVLDDEWRQAIQERLGQSVGSDDTAVYLTPEQILKGTQFLDQLVKRGDSTWIYESFGAGVNSVSGLGALFSLLHLEMGLTVKEKA